MPDGVQFDNDSIILDETKSGEDFCISENPPTDEIGANASECGDAIQQASEISHLQALDCIDTVSTDSIADNITGLSEEINESSEKLNYITQGNLMRALIRFSVPLILALFVQALYSVADLMIVGQFGNSASVSAVSIGGQLMHTVTVVIGGITMGGTVLIGRCFGAKDYKRAAKAVGSTTVIGMVLAIVLTAIIIGCATPISHAMNVPAEAFDQYRDYVIVCGGGIVFIAGYNVFSAVFRGIGNSKLPFFIILVASVVNILLDLLFVGLLKMDAIGAAAATVIAQGVSVIACIVMLAVKKMPFAVKKSDFKLERKSIFDMLKLGVPLALQDGLTSISFLVISAFINSLGVVASASVGIAERLYLFLIIVPMAFMSTLATFVAQNMGANNPARAKKSLYTGLIISFSFGVAICLLTYFGGGLLTRLFSTDAAVIASCSEYLKACSFEYLLTAVFYCFIGYFNGRSQTAFTMTTGILVAFAVRVPLSYAFTHIAGVDMFTIGTAVPISAAVATALCLAYFVILMFFDKRRAARAEVLA